MTLTPTASLHRGLKIILQVASLQLLNEREFESDRRANVSHNIGAALADEKEGQEQSSVDIADTLFVMRRQFVNYGQ